MLSCCRVEPIRERNNLTARSYSSVGQSYFVQVTVEHLLWHVSTEMNAAHVAVGADTAASRAVNCLGKLQSDNFLKPLSKMLDRENQC